MPYEIEIQFGNVELTDEAAEAAFAALTATKGVVDVVLSSRGPGDPSLDADVLTDAGTELAASSVATNAFGAVVSALGDPEVGTFNVRVAPTSRTVNSGRSRSTLEPA